MRSELSSVLLLVCRCWPQLVCGDGTVSRRVCLWLVPMMALHVSWW
jgi:hypothetical protein